MASAGDVYLPDLEACFAGQASVVSWTDILTNIVRKGINDTSDLPLAFLTSPHATQILSISQLFTRPVPTLPKPSPKAKEAFESKTAAINVTPRLDAPYSIDEIKEDTLWLSTCLDLEEIECLRIVLLEWQTRPVALLRNGLSETEDASLRDALGHDEYAVGRANGRGVSGLSNPEFHSQSQRRGRLIALCMQEQGSMFRISVALTDILVQVDVRTSCGLSVLPAPHLAGRLRTVVKGNLNSANATQGGLSACLYGLKERLEIFSGGPQWAGKSFDTFELQDQWTCSLLHQISAMIELILLHHKSPAAHTETHHVLEWIRLMCTVDFFDFNPQSPMQATLCNRIQALASTCTIALLYLSNAMEYLEYIRANPELPPAPRETIPYFMDPDAAAEIHQIMMSFAGMQVVHAAPAVLAWGLILGNTREVAAISKELREASHVQKALDGGLRESPQGRRLSSGSSSSFQLSPSEEVMDSIRSISHGEDDIDELNRAAVVTCDVFQYITHICASESLRTPVGTIAQADSFQQLIITSIAQTEYTAGIVAAQLALIDAVADTALEYRPTGDTYGPRVRLFHEHSGVRGVLDVAASRFPYETLPFLQLCTSLARIQYSLDNVHDYLGDYLQNLSTFTQITSPSFSAYHTTREYQNANLVSLDAHLGMLDGSEFQRLLDSHGQATELPRAIPSGTIGEVISERKPPVIKWLHSYSGFAFLGIWLDAFRCGQLQETHPDQDDLEATAGVILELLSRVLSFDRRDSATKLESNLSILIAISHSLPDDVDLVSIVFDICEQQLQSLRYSRQDQRGCDVVVACLHLITTLLPVLPSRIWSSLSRSTLVNTRGTSAAVFAIILSIETTQERYDFLEAYTGFYSVMVECAVRQAIRVDTRCDSTVITAYDEHIGGGVPARLITGVVQASTRSMMDSFQEASRWEFASPDQKTRIVTNLAQTFQSVLEYTYGADDAPNVSSKLTASLAASAMHIEEVLRPHADEILGPVGLLRWLLFSWQRSVEPSDLGVAWGLSKQVCAIMSLTRTAIRLGTLLNSPQKATEKQILDAVPIIVRLGTLDTESCLASLELLQSLLQASLQDDSPPLLGRLGSTSARAFLESLLPTIRPTKDTLERRDQLQTHVWDLFAALVTHSQQWFAIILLRGSPPSFLKKKPVTDADSDGQPPLRGKTVLAEALDYLVDIKNSNLEVAASVLSFVVKSQIHWSWVTDSVQTHPKLLPSLITFVCQPSSQAADPLVGSQSNKTAALVVELATVHLHYARSRLDKTMIEKLSPLIQWCSSNAISVAGYNVSLHSSLRKNFSARYEPCTLANFKRTRLLERPYGKDFYYEITLADKMLSHGGLYERRPDFDRTFQDEFERVNLNLSLVDSRMQLLNSFQSLCVEHATLFGAFPDMQKLMAIITQNLLIANTNSPPPELLFERLFQTRADFALVMIRKLAETKAKGLEVSRLLRDAWNALRYRNETYERAIDNDDLFYFRTTLTILLMAVQFHTEKWAASQDRLAHTTTDRDPTSSIILEIASVIVADGMKSVVSCIHEQATDLRKEPTSPDTNIIDSRDVALILAILQAILRLHILPHINSQLSASFISSSILQSCLLLYSWSHSLTRPAPNNEPLYADLSLRFLVSLSSLPPVAEDLAVEGILSRIATARITQLLCSVKNGASQLDKRPHAATLYRVWASGLLPLCVNLLHSVGRAMAAEVAGFLNQFPAQLARASKAFHFHGGHHGEPLTLVLANEGAVLALVSRLLGEYRAAGASVGVDAFEVPTLAGYDEEKAAIADDVREILDGGRLKVDAVAVSEKEVAWRDEVRARRVRWKDGKDGDGNDDGEIGKKKGRNKLEEAIAAELRNVLACLT